MGGHRIPANQPSSDPDPFRERVNCSRTSRAAPACVTRPFTITLKKTNRSTVTKDQTSHHRNHHPHRSSRVDAAPSRTAGNFFFFPITSTLSLSLSSLFLFFSIADHTPTLLTQAASKSCSSMWGVFLPAVRASSHPCTESLRSTLHPDRAFPTPTPRGENGKKVVALQGMDTLRDVQIP